MRTPEANRSDARLRILYLDYTNNIGLGGGQQSLALLLRNLDRSRFDPLVACPREERLRQIITDPTIPILSLDLGEKFRSLSRHEAGLWSLSSAVADSWEAAERLSRLLDRYPVDIIHANNLKMLWLALKAGHRRGIPVLWHVREIHPATILHNVLYRLASYGASRVIAVSQAVADQFPGRSNVIVLYNAVELPDLEHSLQLGNQFRIQHGIPAEATVIGYAGRLDRDKGLDSLLAAFQQAALAREGVQLLIAGDGPDRERLKGIITGAWLDQAVHLIPHQADMAPVWSAMDLCVQPSSGPDAFPRSVIEAMSYGKPVLGSTVGGIREAIEVGVTGHCFAPGGVNSLAGLLAALARNKETRLSMGDRGRARCEALFSARRQAGLLKDIYEEFRNTTPRAKAA
ncbi:MAG: glycosyltransferase family 4 protein [Acidimicrobiia bacterium]|nr:glycosyltransferase family 4 protein [Acidimicrobiia bacterium]